MKEWPPNPIRQSAVLGQEASAFRSSSSSSSSNVIFLIYVCWAGKHGGGEKEVGFVFVKVNKKIPQKV